MLYHKLRNSPSPISTLQTAELLQKVFVQALQSNSDRSRDDWILVRAYPHKEPNYVEGWVHRDYLFWSPDAAEWFSPEDGLSRMYSANAARFEAEIDRQMAAARAREAQAARRARLGAIAQIAGSYIGGTAGDITRTVGSHVTGALASIQAQGHIRAAIGAAQQFEYWQQVADDYRANAPTIDDLVQIFEEAKIIIDPNDLPF